MSERIMLLGGSQWAVNSFRALKELGFEILLTDRNPECPGRPYSSDFFQISATETQDILKIASRYDSLFICYCGNDFGAQSALKVNEAIHGRSLAEADPDIFIHKIKMKAFFEKNEIPTARGELVSMDDIDIDALNYPVIIKPVAASGAVGVRHIRDRTAAAAYLSEFQGVFSEVVIEEVLTGTQHDVNGFFVDGNFYPAGLSDRYFTDFPLCYPIHGFSPSQLPAEKIQACYDSIEKIGRAAGLVTGPLKSDVFMGEDGVVRTNEVCLRFHGDITSSIVLPNTGHWFPLLQYVQKLLPHRADEIQAYLEEKFFSKRQVVRWDILRFKPGIFREVLNLEELRARPEVIDVLLAKRRGDLLKKVEDNRDMLGYLLTCADDYAQCAKNAEKNHSEMQVSIDENVR